MADPNDYGEDFLSRPEETLEQRLARVERQEAAEAANMKELKAALKPETPEPGSFGLTDYAVDTMAGFNRGVMGAVDETVDFVAEGLGAIPGLEGIAEWSRDFEIRDAAAEIGLGAPTQTLPGQLTEGVTQFLAGFIPTNRAARAATAGRGLVDSVIGARGTIGQAAAAGALTDAVVFDPHEGRLSDLIEQYPALSNPVTQYLESSPDDTDAEGRFKNALEGVLIGGAVDGLALVLKQMRHARRIKAAQQADETRAANTLLGEP
jgi:hypothetical protein